MMISLSDRVENVVGKGENAGYQHFLLFPQSFQKPELNARIVWERNKNDYKFIVTLHGYTFYQTNPC